MQTKVKRRENLVNSFFNFVKMMNFKSVESASKLIQIDID